MSDPRRIVRVFVLVLALLYCPKGFALQQTGQPSSADATGGALTKPVYPVSRWQEFKDIAEDRGISLTLSYGLAIQANPIGGHRQSAANASVLYFGAEFDLHRLINTNRGLSLYTSVVYNSGRNLSLDIHNVFPVAELWAGDTVRLDELYLRQKFPIRDAELKIGRIVGSWDFAFSHPLTYYVSFEIFANPGPLFLNTPIPSDPYSTWGVYFSFLARSNVRIKAAVYQGNRYGWQNRFHGLNFSLESPDGVLFISQMDISNTAAQSGNYVLGAYYVAGRNLGNYGGYVLLDQEVWHGKTGSITPWIVGLIGPGDENPVTWFLGAGVVWQGLFCTRPRDFFCIGSAYARFNPAFLGGVLTPFRESLIGLLGKFEALVEVNYWIELTPWLAVTPVLQWISGIHDVERVDDAVVVGVQISVTL